MLDIFADLVSQYGYFIVFITIMLECAGIPMPGETALIVAAAFAGTGKLDISLVILIAAASAIAGDAGGYWIGRYYGRTLIERYGKFIHINDHRLSVIQGYFTRHGSKTVFFGRFFSILRTYSALFAGICRMPYGTFTLYNGLGGITWAVTFGVIGYLFGQNLPLLQKIVHTLGWALTIPLVLIAGIILLWRWLLRHKDRIATRIPAHFSVRYVKGWVASHSFQIHWVLRHWKAREYVALHLGTGFIVIAVALVVAGRLAMDVFSGGGIGEFDREVQRLFASWATPLATSFFTTVSNLIDASMVTFGVGATIVFFLKGRNIQLLTLILKLSVARARPIAEILPSVIDFGYSFPSGHALSAFVLFGLLAYFFLLPQGTFFFRTGMVTTALISALMVGFGRLYLGTNYFSDVMGGFAIGILWLAVCISASELYRRGKVGDRRKKKRLKAKSLPDEAASVIHLQPQTPDKSPDSPRPPAMAARERVSSDR
jgi:membrane protein DedA with SNARE-associated domain/membrane-associated phospholipid phosphatase